jgi:hypothetical protein
VISSFCKDKFQGNSLQTSLDEIWQSANIAIFQNNIKELIEVANKLKYQNFKSFLEHQLDLVKTSFPS